MNRKDKKREEKEGILVMDEADVMQVRRQNKSKELEEKWNQKIISLRMLGLRASEEPKYKLSRADTKAERSPDKNWTVFEDLDVKEKLRAIFCWLRS